jgi:hypothetical protein
MGTVLAAPLGTQDIAVIISAAPTENAEEEVSWRIDGEERPGGELARSGGRGKGEEAGGEAGGASEGRWRRIGERGGGQGF